MERVDPMKRSLIACAGLVLLLPLLATPSEAQKPDKVSLFMRAKLQQSQKVIEGLAVEDFDMIAKSAQEMSLLSRAEEWQVLATPEYAQHSMEFRRSADALTEAAKKKNLDGAALQYVDVTLKCVSCHKYVRRVRAAQLDVPRDTAIGQ